jgi:RNA polymerase sigma factor (sigma-70 family)
LVRFVARSRLGEKEQGRFKRFNFTSTLLYPRLDHNGKNDARHNLSDFLLDVRFAKNDTTDDLSDLVRQGDVRQGQPAVLYDFQNRPERSKRKRFRFGLFSSPRKAGSMSTATATTSTVPTDAPPAIKKRVTRPVSRRTVRDTLLPSYVKHVTFNRSTAAKTFDAKALLATPISYDEKYMPDDVTRDHAKRMHYAAHRMHEAKTNGEMLRWQARYHALRDCIVLGNRKLIYRAVRRRMSVQNRQDDMIGDCHIVLIQAVAAYNPWLGIRFSTYAYTCLVRALARMNQKLGTDWLARSASLDAMPDGEPRSGRYTEPSSSGTLRLDEYLKDDHPLLTEREKEILSRRFSLDAATNNPTLERVGEAMGLSKERVRQVQASALAKLRKALLDPIPVAPPK